ncbi:MAG: hypothetical protein ACM3MF_12255 [Anaerolineae bacterium]
MSKDRLEDLCDGVFAFVWTLLFIRLADSLVAELDRLSWSAKFEPFVIPGRDLLEDMDRFIDER